ncbi:MAG: hypothetical protein KY460_00660 [Actinobacteria bacterium]|nr:hypothetical protein [Actinomycetota bacterium]
MTESFEPLDDETSELPPAGGAEATPPMARVNLLPAEVGIERRRRQIAVFALGVLAAYLVGLMGVYALKVGHVNSARAERDATEREVMVLRAEVASLNEFQNLLDTVQNRETLLIAAMEGELSWARILGDLALSFDRQSSLTALDGASTASDAAVTDGEAILLEDGLDLGEPVAQVDFTGYSVDRFAPGVEEVLAKFDDTIGFDDSYLATAGDEERGGTEVTNFIGRVQIDDRAYTHRYDDGLPEENLR